MRLSIVTTLYYSESYIEEFHKRISAEAQKITPDYEIIFVNDGSPDHSLEIVLSLYQKDQHVKIIDLSRNFGHHKAMMTGLAEALGDYVFLIDVDLEELPEHLSAFWQTLQVNPDYDVVYGMQTKRKGRFFERFSGYLFYLFFNCLSETKIPKNFLTIRLMSKRYVKSLTAFREREINFSTLSVLTGFKQISKEIEKGSHSPTSYTLLKRFGIFINALTSSTSRPLWFIFYTGLVITSISILFIIKLMVARFFGTPLQGWTSVMVAILFFGGVLILFQGLIGIYLSKIFSETKNRPYTLIKEKYFHEDESK